MGQDHFSPEATGLDYYPPEVTEQPFVNLLDDVLIERAAPALDNGEGVFIERLLIWQRGHRGVCVPAEHLTT